MAFWFQQKQRSVITDIEELGQETFASLQQLDVAHDDPERRTHILRAYHQTIADATQHRYCYLHELQACEYVGTYETIFDLNFSYDLLRARIRELREKLEKLKEPIPHFEFFPDPKATTPTFVQYGGWCPACLRKQAEDREKKRKQWKKWNKAQKKRRYDGVF